ncbi:MAG: YHS domain-containing protein [Ignavibacteriaceae bacterium]
MKKLFVAAFVLLFGISFSNVSLAQEETAKKEAKEMSKDEAKPAEVKVVKDGKAANTICPVSKESVDDPIVVEYKGKNYNLCCKSCLKKFTKDPEKYISRLSDDGKSMKKGS